MTNEAKKTSVTPVPFLCHFLSHSPALIVLSKLLVVTYFCAICNLQSALNASYRLGGFFSPGVCISKRMARINQLVGSLRSRSQGSATRRRLQHIHVSEGGRLGKKSWSLIHTNSFRTDKHSALKHGLVDTFNRRAQFEDSEILHENDCVSFYQWPLDWEGWVLRWWRSYLEPALRISWCSSTGRGLLCSASYWKGNCHAFVVFVVVCLFVHMTLCCCS